MMVKNQHHNECCLPCCDCPPQPCRPNEPPVRKATFLMERVLAQGCIEACQNLTIRLEDPCTEPIEKIENICYDSCIQSCAPCHTQRLDAWECQQIPVRLQNRDACGALRCTNGTLQLCIPLRILERECCSGVIRSLLLLKICPICVIRHCGNCLDIQAEIAAQLYLTCVQPQGLCIPAPQPHCCFPPLYPQPCFDKKPTCFAH